MNKEYQAKTHGNGQFLPSQFMCIGENVTIEDGVLAFHPENIKIGDDVYIGHYSILKGYYRNHMDIGNGTWIGQQCFLHSAGGIVIGDQVGIGPGVKIITSSHETGLIDQPILRSPVVFAPVAIGENSDIGVGAIILPGVTVGKGVQVGAGAVVTADIEDWSIVAGVPARVIGNRKNQ